MDAKVRAIKKQRSLDARAQIEREAVREWVQASPEQRKQMAIAVRMMSDPDSVPPLPKALPSHCCPAATVSHCGHDGCIRFACEACREHRALEYDGEEWKLRVS